MRWPWKINLIFIIPAIFLIYQLLTLNQYGIDWDTLNHLPRGQAYLQYFLTGKKNYSLFPQYVEYHQDESTILFSPDKTKSLIPSRSIYEVDGFDASYLLKKDGGHPPLSDILSSIFNYIFFQKLRIISDIDSYHLYIVTASALLIGLIFWWTKKNFGIVSSIISVLSLVLYPLFTAESHFNLKDVPEATFYAATLILFYEGVVNKKTKYLFYSAIFFGLAWGTKFNILFAPISIFLWFFILAKGAKQKYSKYLWLLKPLIIFAAIGCLIFFGSWPFLWKNTLSSFALVVKYYKTIGINTNFDRTFIHLGLNTYAIQWILYTTPLITLFFSLFGVIKTITSGFDEKNKTSIFVLLWFLVPIARVTMPNAGIYGGVRQIMEFIPPMAILAGIGATYFRDLILKHIKLNISLLNMLLILSFIPITLKLISIHPNENVYFNPLIGGLKGAAARNFPYWGTSFGNPYRQASDWVNHHASKNSTLVLSQELMPNLPRSWVRSDITYANSLRSGYLRQGEYVIGLEYGDPLNQSYYSSRYYNRYLNPIYQIKIDGTSILNIWKNDEEHTKKDYLPEKKLMLTNSIITNNGIFIDLGKKLTISKISWTFDNQQCKEATNIYFEVSIDNKTWHLTPHTLPNDLPIPIQDRQPTATSIFFPFAAENAQYIFVNVQPVNACVKKIKGDINISYLPEVKTN